MTEGRLNRQGDRQGGQFNVFCLRIKVRVTHLTVLYVSAPQWWHVVKSLSYRDDYGALLATFTGELNNVRVKIMEDPKLEMPSCLCNVLLQHTLLYLPFSRYRGAVKTLCSVVLRIIDFSLGPTYT